MVQGEKHAASSRIILGCNALSTLPTRRAAFRLLETAVRCGIRHFDTARTYGQGFSERILGEFLAGQGPDFIVTTKSGQPDGSIARVPTWLALPMNALKRNLGRSRRTAGVASPPGNPHSGERITREYLERSIEASLRSLKRSWIDVFLLHERLPSQLDEGARSFIATLLADRTLRAFGTGTSRATLESWSGSDDLCTVLQYDYAAPGSDSLIRRFPALTHYHYGLFRNRRNTNPAAILREALAANPAGKVLCGTRNRHHLEENVRGASAA